MHLIQKATLILTKWKNLIQRKDITEFKPYQWKANKPLFRGYMLFLLYWRPTKMLTLCLCLGNPMCVWMQWLYPRVKKADRGAEIQWAGWALSNGSKTHLHFSNWVRLSSDYPPHNCCANKQGQGGHRYRGAQGGEGLSLHSMRQVWDAGRVRRQWGAAGLQWPSPWQSAEWSHLQHICRTGQRSQQIN